MGCASVGAVQRLGTMRLTAATTLAAALCGLSALSAAAEDRAGAPSGADYYTLDQTQGTIKVKVGATGTAHLTVTPKAGAHVSPEAPITVLLSGGPALDLPKAKLVRGDSKPNAAQGIDLDLPFTAKAAGKDELKANFTFYICHADLCERQQKTLSFLVSIE